MSTAPGEGRGGDGLVRLIGRATLYKWSESESESRQGPFVFGSSSVAREALFIRVLSLHQSRLSQTEVDPPPPTALVPTPVSAARSARGVRRFAPESIDLRESCC